MTHTTKKRRADDATLPGNVGNYNGQRSNQNCQTKQGRLRAELAQLRACYDGGAVAPAIYAVIRELETEIAWGEARAEEMS